MSYPGNNKILRLFYRTEDIIVLQENEPNKEEYNKQQKNFLYLLKLF